eukprot:CAMPEP_0115832608 /NCGR_PEP_ID=MMETSP0287-20121206/2747_1 /TAXON_ID=412157 /ORGANISM="Chrysochromulina rotalis, Strain UIO044" /LENGTH=93 /DNA_ID=CAMNT_0003286001 /DNA_START=99 /DNA_END=380 /DNA_ORIENTATION=-
MARDSTLVCHGLVARTAAASKRAEARTDQRSRSRPRKGGRVDILCVYRSHHQSSSEVEANIVDASVDDGTKVRGLTGAGLDPSSPPCTGGRGT